MNEYLKYSRKRRIDTVSPFWDEMLQVLYRVARICCRISARGIWPATS
jgi:hypothetical protein